MRQTVTSGSDFERGYGEAWRMLCKGLTGRSIGAKGDGYTAGAKLAREDYARYEKSIRLGVRKRIKV